jgi:hypothetical protein
MSTFTRLMSLWVALVAAAAGASEVKAPANPVSEAPPHIRPANSAVKSPPETLKIVAVTDGKPATYSTSIWLVADDESEPLIVVPSGLTPVDGGAQPLIPASSIHVNGDSPFALQKNTPKILNVTVNTALTKAELTGTLEFRSPKFSAAVYELALSLSLAPKPVIATVPPQFNFRVTRCTMPVTCYLSRLFVSSGLNASALRWQLSNQAPSRAVSWHPQPVTLHGDKRGAFVQLDVGAWTSRDSFQAFPAGSLQPLPADNLFQSLEPLLPDHYQGQYRVDLEGADSQTAEIGIDVRDGPLLPLAVLIAGVVIGRILLATNSAIAQSQMRLLDKYSDIARLLSQVQDPASRRALTISLENLRLDIRLMVRSEADIAADLTSISRLVVVAFKLDRLEPQIAGETDQKLKQQMQTELAAGRAAIAAPDVVGAESSLEKLLKLFTQSANGPQQNAAATVRGLNMVAAAAAPPAGVQPAATRRARSAIRAVGSVMTWLSGARPPGEAWYHYGRPLVFTLLLAGLAFVGLYNSYLHNATFGSEGYFDYLSLFLWGISTDVAQKSLQQLTLTK